MSQVGQSKPDFAASTLLQIPCKTNGNNSKSWLYGLTSWSNCPSIYLKLARIKKIPQIRFCQRLLKLKAPKVSNNSPATNNSTTSKQNTANNNSSANNNRPASNHSLGILNNKSSNNSTANYNSPASINLTAITIQILITDRTVQLYQSSQQ